MVEIAQFQTPRTNKAEASWCLTSKSGQTCGFRLAHLAKVTSCHQNTFFLTYKLPVETFFCQIGLVWKFMAEAIENWLICNANRQCIKVPANNILYMLELICNMLLTVSAPDKRCHRIELHNGKSSRNNSSASIRIRTCLWVGFDGWTSQSCLGMQ